MYFGTHNHSEYSNITTGLDSINHISDLIKKAKELGMRGLAITDHDNLSQVIEVNRLQKKLRENNDDFVLAQGNEIYLVDEYDPEDNVREKYYHFILIAKDKIGYQAIVELSSRAWYRSSVKYGKRRVPTLKRDLYDIITPEVKGHIIAATACIGGELAHHILADDMVNAHSFVFEMMNIFGPDDFYIELQPSQSIEQMNFNLKVLKEYSDSCQFIISTDAHYQNKEDFNIFEAFLRSKNESREVKEFYDYARLMDENEIYELMSCMGIDKAIVKKCLDNTLKIADQIEFYDLAQPQVVPTIQLPEIKMEVPKDRLKDLMPYEIIKWALKDENESTHYCAYYCVNKLYELNKWTTEYFERLEEEFDVFKFQGDKIGQSMFAYFNVIQHYMDMAWKIGDAIGPSRGSASGSLVCYLMGITQCDPIQYGLYFWRFMNKDRVELPDIDFDSQPSKKLELFEEIRKERGELGLTQVAAFRTLTLKSAINQAGRGYRDSGNPNGLDADITRYISSLVEVKRGAVATLKQTLEGDETLGFKKNSQFIKDCNQFPGLIDIIGKIEGLIVGSTTHASAVLLFDDRDRLIDHSGLMRAPNGDLCSALDLHTCEEAGALKYDFLMLSTLDIQTACFDLLRKDGVIPADMSLRDCYRTYIDPNKIDYDNELIWEKLYNNEVLSVFQWDAASGRKGILATEPQTLSELTAVNGLIRLMTAPGEEDQIERFVRIKADPESFEEEMIRNGVSEQNRKYMHEELDRFNGCAATQESFMILTQKICGYTLKEANTLRKVVAKKKMSEITAQRDLFFEKCPEPKEVTEYLWNVIVRPSLGYGFSYNHALPYSMIGVQCVLMGGVSFLPIYWQTACLLQRSGALDSKSADYNKIAKAVCSLLVQNVNIAPLDINKSERIFSMNAETNTIYFGFLGVKGLKEKVIHDTLELRPFVSMYDFMDRVKPDVTSMVALIKSGAFDEFGSREDNIMEFIAAKADTKTKLNGQNLLMISREGYWPEELSDSQKVFNFTQYLKKISKELNDKENYLLDERAKTYLDSINYPYSGDYLEKAEWKLYYDQQMIGIKNYLIEHQDDLLLEVNNQVYEDFRTKYFGKGNISFFEIETMGVCFGEHPMANVTAVDDFTMLPTEPILERMFTTKTGRAVPMYELTMIAGIAIAKDKLHHTCTILTSTGPVDVKYRKEEFAHYDAQISKMVGGKKQIVERSWFNRGNMLLIHGMRQDDQFIAKTYKNSPMIHTTYKITDIKDDGKFEVVKNRPTGNEEEDTDVV